MLQPKVTPSSKSVNRADIQRGKAKDKRISDSRTETRENLCRLMLLMGLPLAVDAIANKTSPHPARINDLKQQKQLTGETLGEGGVKLTPKELDEESDVRESRGTFRELLDSYCVAVDTKDAYKKMKKIKYLGNFEGIPLKFRDVLAQEIWRTINCLVAKRRNWKSDQDLGTKPSQEDIMSLKNIYAKCSASVAQELGKKYLKLALKDAEESGLITIGNKYSIEFSINTKAIEKIINGNNQAEYKKIVQLVRCLLISNVQKAQDMWDAVRFNSHNTNHGFKIAKEDLELHLERCASKNSSWQDNSVLNRNFNTAWNKFELDATEKR